jgi:predicted phosphoadenosine phosphosulfate sulfurtransferase
MAKVRKKEYSDVNVYDAAIERIEYLYKRFDTLVVSFSGGKDSTAVLSLTIEVAERLGRLPVKAIFIDEEAIHPTTIEYVERVRQDPRVDLDWYCLPVKHRNACSNDEPFWHCWDPTKKDLWVREMPEWAITENPHFKPDMTFQDWAPRIFSSELGTVCILTGIRTQESIRRLRNVSFKKNDNYITSGAEHGNTFKAFPIYDWSSEDVWKLVEVKGLDYNRTYDIFNKTKLHGRLLTQRVCPPYGEEPLRGLWTYAECFPELWHKMLNRVPGVATAWRYANTELYSNWEKPESKTWREYTGMVLETYTETEYRDVVAKGINSMIREHYGKTDDPIHDSDAHPVSGCSWKFLAKLAVKGDFKNRQGQNMHIEGEKIRAKMGITREEAEEKYGKKKKRRSAN